MFVDSDGENGENGQREKDTHSMRVLFIEKGHFVCPFVSFEIFGKCVEE